MTAKHKIGDWIDNRYQVFDVHVGGMGVVYIVYDHQGEAGRRVLALKTLREEFLRDNRQITRFVTECETWIKLERHPHIVRAYSVQMIENMPYVVLELVTGGDLRRWIGTSRLDLPQVLRFGIQFCLAMEHALQKGLHCHRDIKPENLLITEGGMLKVTDFGLAKIRDEAAGLGPGAPADPIPLAEIGDEFKEDDELADVPDESELRSGAVGGEPDRTDTKAAEAAFLADLGLEVAPTDPGVTVERDASGWGDQALDVYETVDWTPTASPAPDRPDRGAPALGAREQRTLDWSPSRNPPDPFGALPPGPTVDWKSERPEHVEREVTRAGAIVGTGQYMAPEQFRNARTVSHLADLYSFGIVLFEMITTRPPFQGETFAQLAKQHARVPPPSVVPYIPARYAKVAKAVDKIVRRCLEKDPAKRFASFTELRRALAQVLWWAAGEKVKPPTETEMDAWDLTSRGVSLGTLGRIDEEREAYEEAIRVKPDYTPPWFNQAAAKGAQGHYAEAIEYADMALYLNPRSVPALVNKGLALNALGRAQEAIACFDLAAHLQPRDPDVWSGRVIVLLGQGNAEGARVALNQYHRLRPDYGTMPTQFGESPLGTGPWPTTVPPAERTAAQPHTQGEPAWLRTIPWVRRTEDSATEP